MRPGDVAAATRPDRQRRARTARRAEDHAVADDRRRDHLVGVAAAPPQLPAALRVVRLHLLLATDDDLVAGADAHRDRRAPPVAGLTWRAPYVTPRSRVEGGNERSAVLILVEDDAVPVQQRRSRGAVVRLHRPQVPLPDDPSVEIEREQPARAERYINTLTVCGGSGRGVAVLVMRPRSGAARGRWSFPQQPAVGTPVGQHRDPLAALVRGRQEDSIAPDDRR